MSTLPADWVIQVLENAAIQPSHKARAVMNAWHASTPLPPMTNNPIGMPTGSSGAPSYLGTKYAIFPSIGAFYAAFSGLCLRSAGNRVVLAITDPVDYGDAWRAISALGWPGSDTETDYPAAVLDLTAQSYRDSVGASGPDARKTSGMVAAVLPSVPTGPERSASVHNAMWRINSAIKVANNLRRKG